MTHSIDLTDRFDGTIAIPYYELVLLSLLTASSGYQAYAFDVAESTALRELDSIYDYANRYVSRACLLIY